MTCGITIDQLRASGIRGLRRRIVALSEHIGRVPLSDEPIPLAAWAEITPAVSDLIWMLRFTPSGARIAQEVARRAAMRSDDYAERLDAESAHERRAASRATERAALGALQASDAAAAASRNCAGRPGSNIAFAASIAAGAAARHSQKNSNTALVAESSRADASTFAKYADYAAYVAAGNAAVDAEASAQRADILELAGGAA